MERERENKREGNNGSIVLVGWGCQNLQFLSLIQRFFILYQVKFICFFSFLLDKESVDSKVLAQSINSNVKIASECSWDQKIE